MALANIIASISYWIGSFLWVCSQPVYWIHYIYETNYEAVSALFSAVLSCLYYTAKAVQLLLLGAFSMVEMIIQVLANAKYVFRFIADLLYASAKLGIQVSQVAVCVFGVVLENGPWMVENAWQGVTWCYKWMTFCVKWALDTAQSLPSPSVLLEPLKGIASVLCDDVAICGSWLIKTVTYTVTGVSSVGAGLVAGALAAVWEACLRCVDNLWQMRTAVDDSIMTAVAYLSRKTGELYVEILEASSDAFGSLVDLLVALASTLFYVGLFAIVCLVLIVVPIKLYSMFVKALRAANNLVRLLHHSLSQREHNNLRNREPQPQNRQRLPQERDTADADEEESLLQPLRRAPRVPQPGQQPPGASRPGPSRQQNQSPFNPQRSSPSPPVPNPSIPTSVADDLARKLEEERDRQLCVVCQDKPKNILIMPCKHLCVCLQCVEEITGQPRREARKCPLCREVIRSYLEVYA